MNSKANRSYLHNIQLIAIILLSTIVMGCSKSAKDNCDVINKVVPANELAQLEEYIASKNIIADRDAKGFYYSINNIGNDKKPTACSNVTVDYVGKLTNGQILIKIRILLLT